MTTGFLNKDRTLSRTVCQNFLTCSLMYDMVGFIYVYGEGLRK